jgi:DNA polymerase-3 subunit delta'
MFESVIDQEPIGRMLMTAFRSGHLPHAMIFVGPEGVGKDAVALELARLVLCPNGKGDDDCSVCHRAAKIGHPDLQFVVPLPRSSGSSSDEPLGVKLKASAEEDLIAQLKLKAENPYHEIQLTDARYILIDQIRALKRMVSLRSYEHGAKVYIISQAHRLTDDAQVSLLKILEEPPPNTYIILTATTDTALLPTIRSRCQQIKFPPLSVTAIEEALVERNSLSPERAMMISKMADGSYRRAVVLLNDESILQRDDVLVFLRAAYTGKSSDLHNCAIKMTQQRSVSDIEEALKSMLSFLHDAWTLKIDESYDALAFADNRDTVLKFSKTLTQHNLEEFEELVEEAIEDIKGNVIPGLVMITLGFHIHRLFRKKKSKQHGCK